VKSIRQLKVTFETSVLRGLEGCRPSISLLIWLPPGYGCFKWIFDVAILVKLFLLLLKDFPLLIDVFMFLIAALLSTQLAAFAGVGHFLLKGDALFVILAVNQPFLFSSRQFSSFVSDIILDLSSFHNCYTIKVYKCANYCIHALANGLLSPIFSSIRINNGNDLL
jgi:hypothetical protein